MYGLLSFRGGGSYAGGTSSSRDGLVSPLLKWTLDSRRGSPKSRQDSRSRLRGLSGGVATRATGGRGDSGPKRGPAAQLGIEVGRGGGEGDADTGAGGARAPAPRPGIRAKEMGEPARSRSRGLRKKESIVGSRIRSAVSPRGRSGGGAEASAARGERHMETFRIFGMIGSSGVGDTESGARARAPRLWQDVVVRGGRGLAPRERGELLVEGSPGASSPRSIGMGTGTSGSGSTMSDRFPADPRRSDAASEGRRGGTAPRGGGGGVGAAAARSTASGAGGPAGESGERSAGTGAGCGGAAAARSTASGAGGPAGESGERSAGTGAGCGGGAASRPPFRGLGGDAGLVGADRLARRGGRGETRSAAGAFLGSPADARRAAGVASRTGSVAGGGAEAGGSRSRSVWKGGGPPPRAGRVARQRCRRRSSADDPLAVAARTTDETERLREGGGETPLGVGVGGPPKGVRRKSLWGR